MNLSNANNGLNMARRLLVMEGITSILQKGPLRLDYDKIKVKEFRKLL